MVAGEAAAAPGCFHLLPFHWFCNVTAKLSQRRRNGAAVTLQSHASTTLKWSLDLDAGGVQWPDWEATVHAD